MLEKAAKQWRDFKGKLTRNFLRAGKDPCEVYHFISREQWETYKNRRESAEFKVKNMELLLACVWHNFFLLYVYISKDYIVATSVQESAFHSVVLEIYQI